MEHQTFAPKRRGPSGEGGGDGVHLLKCDGQMGGNIVFHKRVAEPCSVEEGAKGLIAGVCEQVAR